MQKTVSISWFLACPRCKQYLHCFWAPQAKILCLPRLNITGMFSVFFLLMPRTLQIPCSWLVEVQTNMIYIIHVFVGLPRLKDICSVFGLYCSKARPVPSRLRARVPCLWDVRFLRTAQRSPESLNRNTLAPLRSPTGVWCPF